MKVLYWDEQSGRMKVKVESQDDLWALYNVVEKEDVVFARTSRELKGSSGTRRRAMTLGIRVEWTEFQPFTTRLRIHGIVIAHPEEYEVHGHHTINVDIGDEVTIIKEEGWPRHALERIEKACKRRAAVVVAGIDDSEFAAGIIHDYGVQMVSEFYFNIPGKMDAEARVKAIESQYSKAAQVLKEICETHRARAVVLAGPGVWKELVAENLRNQLKGISVFVENASSGGVKGVREALRRGAALKVLSEFGIVEEEKLLEELLQVLTKCEGRVAFGLEEVEKASELGAVEKLMVLDELLRSPDLELRRRMEKLLQEVERKRGFVKIFSSVHDAGKQLKNLGGIAAILRFSVR